jgi:hypothetical protein
MDNRNLTSQYPVRHKVSQVSICIIDTQTDTYVRTLYAGYRLARYLQWFKKIKYGIGSVEN